jgi:hypothetical protein
MEYKYLKYKIKYLNLKKSLGGMDNTNDSLVAIARQSTKETNETNETIETIEEKIKNWENHKNKIKILLFGVTNQEILYDQDKYLIIFFDTLSDPNSKLNWLEPTNYDIFIDNGIKFDYIFLDYYVHSAKCYGLAWDGKRIKFKDGKYHNNFCFDNVWQALDDNVYVKLRLIIEDGGKLFLPKYKPYGTEREREKLKKDFENNPRQSSIDYRWLRDHDMNLPGFNPKFRLNFNDIKTETTNDPINSNYLYKDYPIERISTTLHGRKHWLIFIPRLL